MSRSEWRIRLATAHDAEALSAFAERTFRDTFSDSNTPSDMDAYCASAFGVDIQRRELTDPATVTLLVEKGGHLIAYAQLVSRTPPCSVRARQPIELKRFYLDRSFHGSSLAPALMSAAEERARTSGADLVWLGVWERNPRAIRFYRKCGFDEIGEQVFAVGADAQRDLVMGRVITRFDINGASRAW